ncbi:MAG: mycothiol synthase [Acidimicrobiia bacterium]|nr:mycothiol synthase [Acidimicrobiia bacterium]
MDVTTSRFHPDQRPALRAFISATTAHDGEPSLSEYKEMRLDGGIDSREVISVDAEGRVVGYGQAAWHRAIGGVAGHWAMEVVVAPAHRESALAARLIEELRREAGKGQITLWARSPDVTAAARANGWVLSRRLLEMRTSLPIPCAPEGLAGFALTAFRMGVDEHEWLSANNEAFAGHPENGSMTRRDLERRIARPWFDPEGFFLAWDGESLAGSCWTKVHEDGVGEIYIVAVTPGWEGRGLGYGLVCHGLDYLASKRQVSSAMLFVGDDNDRAIALYEKLGFTRTRVLEAFEFGGQS